MQPGYVFVKVRNWLEIRRDKGFPVAINWYVGGRFLLVSAPRYIFVNLWRGWMFRLWFLGVPGHRLIVGFQYHPRYDHRMVQGENA